MSQYETDYGAYTSQDSRGGRGRDGLPRRQPRGAPVVSFEKKDNPDTKIVILTTFGRPGFLRRAMESGVSAFLVKDSPADKLSQTIRRVLAGERVIDPDLAAAALADGVNPLTPRERDVLEASADGRTIAEIAAQLYLSEGTVRNYLSACIQKTGARNRAEALRIASERGWL